MISTWGFGKAANERALAVLQAGGSRLDAIEQGIRVTEASGNKSVGLSGHPNAAGYAQVDACIMDGPGQRAGSVAGVEGVVHPISAARAVLEKSKHAMLVGDGARWFAQQNGVECVDISEHASLKRKWLAGDRKQPERSGHDTIALLLLDANGQIAGGCSTSGAGGKLPGRVGDSPIFGAGLYVDNAVGAAGATGLGENVMRYCGSFLVVEFMRQGMHPQAACEAALRRIASADPKGYDIHVSFVALDKRGRVGAAASNGRFPFSVTRPQSSTVERVAPISRGASSR